MFRVSFAESFAFRSVIALGRVSPIFWLPFVCVLILGYCIAGGSMGDGNFWVGWVFCLLLGLAVNFFHDSSQAHLNFAAQKIALYSYGMYLNHLPVLYLVFIVFGVKNWISGSLLFVWLTMLASATTYHLIESPFVELGRRLSSPCSMPAAAAAPIKPYSDGAKRPALESIETCIQSDETHSLLYDSVAVCQSAPVLRADPDSISARCE